MNETSNVVRRILRDDGTLELAERPTLPAGDVEVTIRPVARAVVGKNWLECLQRIRAEREAADRTSRQGTSEAPRESLWQFMERTRAELEASGHQFRTKEEIDADIEEMRDWDGKIDEVDRQREEEHGRANPK